ncbi:MAG: ribonuclease-3 [Candidatus Midichloriaceae bacterium]|jgi:ribonuclease-3
MELGYTFKDKKLLEVALTHPSVLRNPKEGVESYERMEFLGDSILSAVMADIIYNKFRNYSEGELSVVLANLVNAKILTIVASDLNISKYMILDSGEEQCGGRENSNNLENTLEAVIAAVYLDSDFITVKNLVQKLWARFFLDIEKLFQKDYKTQLQEYAQRRYKILPKYKLENVVGEAHDPVFTMSASIKSKYKVDAEGKSKKEAEQKAALKILKQLEIDEGK